MKKRKLTLILLAALCFITALVLASCGDKCENGHTFGEWETTTAATCYTAGSKTHTCSVCGHTETEEIPATGEHAYGEWTVTKAATCTEQGSKTRACTTSGCTASETAVIPMLPHSYEATWKYDDTNHWHECVCGEKDGLSVHSFGEWTEKEAAICGSDGLEGRTCTICGHEETRVIPAPETHNYGAWETVEPATCGADGTKRRVCSICGDVDEDVIPATGEHTPGSAATCTTPQTCEECEAVLQEALGHDLQYSVTTPPSAADEGVATATCQREGCTYSSTLRILRVATVTYDGAAISWTAVENATGYKLYVDDTATDLGNVLTYVLPPDASTHTYKVAAYTDNAAYYGESAYTLTFSYGDNLQAEKNYDFEKEVSSVIKLERTASWNAYPYGNWSDLDSNGNGGWYYICPDEDGNMVAKVPAVVWYSGNTTLKKDLGAACREANTTYELSFDIKVSARAMELVNSGGTHGKICGYMWGGDLIPLSYGDVAFNTTGITVDSIGDTENWVNIRLRYSVGDTAPSYIQFNLTYWPEGAIGEDNYVLIDNIQVFKVVDGQVDETNVDTIAGGDFEKFSQTVFTENKWYLDNTLLIEQKAIGSRLVKEDDNTVFRAYSAGEEIAFDMSGNLEIAEAGNYKITMKVKLGPDATNVTTLGFCAWAWNGGDAFQLVMPVFFAVDQLTDSEWVTVTAYFASKGLENTTNINLYFFAYTHNDVIESTDNYILFDDVIITKLNVE